MSYFPCAQVNIVRGKLAVAARVNLSIPGSLAPTVETEQEGGQEESAREADAGAYTCGGACG